MAPVALRLTVPVDVEPETVWAAATDWRRQSEWMLGTTVYVVRGEGGPGSRLLAFTGFKDLGFADSMEIVEWRPPLSCRVRHLGELVTGEGGFHVVRRGVDQSIFVWWERLDLPPGGAFAWPFVRPAFEWGIRRSLSAFAQFCRRYRTGGSSE